MRNGQEKGDEMGRLNISQLCEKARQKGKGDLGRR